MLAFPPDFTFLIQFLSFFLLLFVLNRLLFRPFAQLLSEREKRTQGDAESAADDRRRAAELEADIERELAAARVAAMAEAEDLRRRARAQEKRIFEQASQRASRRLAEIRAGVEAEKESVLARLRGETAALAEAMVSAVIGGSPRS
jgi:F-type H+-transporting ATPase subunit b